MEASIRETFAATEVELIESSGGVFEVVADGALIHSKKRSGRFPEWAEVRARLTRQP